MAVTIIEQAPLYNIAPIGQEMMFVVSNDDAVTNQLNVKFIVRIYVSSTTPPVLSDPDDVIGSFKVTPNNEGRGMIDISQIVGNYVKADNLASNGSAFKTQTTSSNEPHPVHLINEYSLSDNSIRHLAIRFSVEYLNTSNNTVEEDTGARVSSEAYKVFNGYLKSTDIKYVGTGTTNTGFFGYDISDFEIGASDKKFLTNAPVTQYANGGDYGTLSFLTTSSIMGTAAYKAKFRYYDSSGTVQGNDNVFTTTATGAYSTWGSEASKQLLHLGCFPANLRNTSTDFKTLYDAGTLDGGYYTVRLEDASNDAMTQSYTIHLNCPDTKGYESIRLCWLNQWGAWDYYTFTKKSIRKTSTKGTTYKQLGGSWNGSMYTPYGYKGGTKTFRVNATETITMNTDFVTENDTVMFEELTNSPEIYMLEPYKDTAASSGTTELLNEYVTPVRLKTSSFTKKTIANDKLMQYTFEVEKSRILRTQSI
tara:strand:+ start:1030 stop:2463 length:1434 start_codon:yes stop_codon:yes gene_type:complete